MLDITNDIDLLVDVSIPTYKHVENDVHPLMVPVAGYVIKPGVPEVTVYGCFHPHLASPENSKAGNSNTNVDPR